VTPPLDEEEEERRRDYFKQNLFVFYRNTEEGPGRSAFDFDVSRVPYTCPHDTPALIAYRVPRTL
jgi:hypothetical protein